MLLLCIVKLYKNKLSSHALHNTIQWDLFFSSTSLFKRLQLPIQREGHTTPLPRCLWPKALGWRTSVGEGHLIPGKSSIVVAVHGDREAGLKVWRRCLLTGTGPSGFTHHPRCIPCFSHVEEMLPHAERKQTAKAASHPKCPTWMKPCIFLKTNNKKGIWGELGCLSLYPYVFVDKDHTWKLYFTEIRTIFPVNNDRY